MKPIRTISSESWPRAWRLLDGCARSFLIATLLIASGLKLAGAESMLHIFAPLGGDTTRYAVAGAQLLAALLLFRRSTALYGALIGGILLTVFLGVQIFVLSGPALPAVGLLLFVVAVLVPRLGRWA
ncbi:MAG: hypothetical protein ACTS1Z_07830 [Parasphingopyxis sp.]|uniref:hypothetical protein n=1 Tax=Parasphingopyxis sp. TaxID=1920299 RepID=UPI003FA0E617